MLTPGALRILVVDDREVIASTLATILQRHGYDAVFFTNPLEALAMASLEAPDCLISDVMMPELPGVELAIRISHLCPHCKILLFSGQAETEDLLASARGQGWAFELLTKPVHPTEILRRVEDYTRQEHPGVERAQRRSIRPRFCGRLPRGLLLTLAA